MQPVTCKGWSIEIYYCCKLNLNKILSMRPTTGNLYRISGHLFIFLLKRITYVNFSEPPFNNSVENVKYCQLSVFQSRSCYVTVFNPPVTIPSGFLGKDQKYSF